MVIKRDIPKFDTVLLHSNWSNLRRKYFSKIPTDINERWVVGPKHKRFRGFWTQFLLRVIRKNPPSMYARVSKVMAQFVLKIEKLSHIMGPAPILEMARAYGLRPRSWLLLIPNKWNFTSATLNDIRFLFFLPRFVDNWKHRLRLESAGAALCKWATCMRQTSLSKTFKLAAQHAETIRKNVWGKSYDAYSLSIRVQTTNKPHFDLFSTTISTSKKMVFIQSLSWKRHCVTHWHEQRSMVGT